MWKYCVVAVLSAYISVAVWSQVQRSESNTMEIELRILKLGMTPSEVTDALSGVQIIKSQPNSWMTSTKSGLSTMAFKNGKLSFIQRAWTSESNRDTAEALFYAVSSLNENGYSACRIKSDSQISPTLEMQRVQVDCGGRAIIVFHSKVEGQWQEDVYEQLRNDR